MNLEPYLIGLVFLLSCTMFSLWVCVFKIHRRVLRLYGELANLSKLMEEGEALHVPKQLVKEYRDRHYCGLYEARAAVKEQMLKEIRAERKAAIERIKLMQ